MKMTEAQRRTLSHMAEGREAWTLSGINPSAFWKDGISGKNPNLATLNALERAGLIEDYKHDFTGRQYRITPAGRIALDQGRQDGRGR